LPDFKTDRHTVPHLDYVDTTKKTRNTPPQKKITSAAFVFLKALSIQWHTSAQIVLRMRERRTVLSIRDKARHTMALRGSPKEESFPVPQVKKMKKFARGEIAFVPVKVSFSSIGCGISLSVLITLLLGL